MEKNIKVGSLIKSRFFTAIVTGVVTYDEYKNTDDGWFGGGDAESYWLCADDDLMICLQTLHDKRKYMPLAGATTWMPETEMRLHIDIERGKDRWEVFGNS
jgi:hypothetical protein|tara:strand:- start:448 stop:750 length:303 start_codon:yes stop_codon:yes gene_type:complete